MYSNAGGSVGTMYRGKSLGASPTFTGSISGGTVLGNNTYATAAGQVGWQNSSIMTAPSDGIIRLTNLAQTDFTRLQFGGTTSSFPAIQRSLTEVGVVLADISGWAPLASGTLDLLNAATSAPAGRLRLGATQQTTVGAAGAAAAQPVPLGYLIGFIGTTKIAIPYHNG